MDGRKRVRLAGCAAAVILFGLTVGSLIPSASGQLGTLIVSSSSVPPATATTRTVTGRVINGVSGASISRALVNLNSRAVLSDAQGRFSFPGFADANGYAQVTKPGYSASPTAEGNRQQRVEDLDAPVELRLYPDALLSGTVTGPDGLPLARTQVRVRRLTFDTNGPRWITAGNTQTDAHGEFRFDLAAGKYSVNTGYTQRSLERGETVLPVRYPANTASNTEYMELAPGEQRQVGLRPRLGPAYPVQLSIDGGDTGRGVRLSVIASSGITFQVPAQKSGDLYTAQLPVGTFLLKASTGDRNEAVSGESRVVVSAPGPAQASIHLSPNPSFPVDSTAELAPVASGTTTPTAPSVQQFNLVLRNLANTGEGIDPDARLVFQPDKLAEFRVQPGHYHLGASLSGAWYISSATCGVTNLMIEDLVVAAGAAGSPIRLTLSNAVGRIKGLVSTAGHPASGWVYLIPQQPSLIPYVELYLQSDGSFQWSGAPGHYLAVPSLEQVHEDFRSEAFLRKFTVVGRDVQISAGNDTTANLTLASAGVAR